MIRAKLVKIIKSLIDLFPNTANLYRQILDYRAFKSLPDLTNLGFKFNGNQMMENGLFEPVETELVKKMFPHVDVIINVGANIGYYVCHALHGGKRVIAFEPIQNNLKYLLRNIKANNWQHRCEVYPVALSNNTNILKIYGGGTGASIVKGWAGISEKYSSLVPSLKLNDVLGERFQGQKVLIIVDVEGAENMMLEGATTLLDMKPKPIWLVEISAKLHHPKGVDINPNLLETFEKFWSRGYCSFSADNNFRNITKEEINKIILTGFDTLGTHNFLFYEKGKEILK